MTAPAESPVKDPAAPYGRKPDGTPYRRDPAPFAHLKGKPFASQNGKASATKPLDGKVKRAKIDSPPAGTAEDYRKKFRRGFLALARMTARKAPATAIVVAVRADDMAESWGKVAVAYPKVGRLVDRFGKGSDLSEAISGTVLTAALIAHGQGLTRGTPIGDWLEDVLVDVVDMFMTNPDFESIRAKLPANAPETEASPDAA